MPTAERAGSEYMDGFKRGVEYGEKRIKEVGMVQYLRELDGDSVDFQAENVDREILAEIKRALQV